MAIDLTKHLPRWRNVVAVLGAAAISAAALSTVGGAASADGSNEPRPTIVLVHGAFADASGWIDVTRRLQRDDYTVIATANPLRSVDSDAAYLESILDTIDGPVVLVGHSYGGFVMTNAAAGDPDVEALVYVAAFAPAPGDTVEALTGMNPGSGLADPHNLVVRPHDGGADGYINPAVFREIFAADLPGSVTDVMAASQRPADVGTLFQASGPAAWESIPSWYVVASEDRTIPPATQRFMAERAGATTIEIRSSHVVMMSHPKQVADLIETAATAVG
jgi:pimeloyl-ACP methyl ester carboxylesterase